jgi:hypothetical protein
VLYICSAWRHAVCGYFNVFNFNILMSCMGVAHGSDKGEVTQEGKLKKSYQQ